MQNHPELVRATSDAYFAAYRGPPFDLVFIDGLHHAEQIRRDIDHSLHRHAAPGRAGREPRAALIPGRDRIGVLSYGATCDRIGILSYGGKFDLPRGERFDARRVVRYEQRRDGVLAQNAA